MSDDPLESPRLRAVEAFPVRQDGQQLIALRDPAGYAETVVLLPPAAVEVVRHFDGRHSLVDIQAELMRRFGELVPRADIERLVAALDEQGFLDSPRFEARRRSVDQAFLAAPTRPAAHAGGAYAADPEALRQSLEAFFTGAEGPGPVRREAAGTGPPVAGIIAPHIDFHRGGPAYAWAYRDLAERCPADVFVIFGTCHAGMPDPFALTRKDHDTPLGRVRVERDLVEALAARAGQDCFASEWAHRQEHSIEFQAVFLQYLFGGRREIAIVPVLTSFAHEAIMARTGPEADPRVARFFAALQETVAAWGRRVAFIAGADLAHVGPRFGDPEPVSETARSSIERQDRAMLEPVAAGDARGFFEAVAAEGDRRRICGLSPIYALLRALGGRRGTVRRYGMWPDPEGVVSYASVVFDGDG
jgi:hypothetical protein